MITPPARGRLTSPFGPRGGTLHDGLDIAAPAGTPIFAAWAGTVVTAQTLHSGWGNQVIIDHGLVDGQRTLTRYAHLLNPPPVRVGQRVAAAEQIGAMGTTGTSTGVHLHFGVYRGTTANYSTAVDPAPFLAAREKTIMALDPRRGADYSRARPTQAQLDRDKIAFCVRYVLDAARDGGKRFTLDEARWLTSIGRRMVANYEYETGRMADGYNAGVADAKIAVAECRMLGMPKGRPIYFSDDTGGTPGASIVAYLGGANSVTKAAGYETGYYGGFRGVTVAHNAGYKWLWQTYAWSGSPTQWHPAATLRQVHNGAFSDWSGDLNAAQTDDFGQWDTTGWTPEQGDDMDPNTVIPIPKGFPAPNYIAAGADLSDLLHGNYWHTLNTEKAIAKLATDQAARDAADAMRDAGILATVTQLADVIKSGGGNVDTAAIVQAIRDGQAEVKDAVNAKAEETLDRIARAYTTAAGD